MTKENLRESAKQEEWYKKRASKEAEDAFSTAADLSRHHKIKEARPYWIKAGDLL